MYSARDREPHEVIGNNHPRYMIIRKWQHFRQNPAYMHKTHDSFWVVFFAVIYYEDITRFMCTLYGTKFFCA